MTKKEQEFKDLVNRLQQTELCKDFDARLLHGFLGIASEAIEIFRETQDGYMLRTDLLIEASDLFHFMEYVMIVFDVSIEDLKANSVVMKAPFVGYSNTSDMVIEAGDLLNRYKKFMYYHGEPFSKKDILRGLSRLYYCLEFVIQAHDSSIEEVMAINIAKLTARYPVGFTHDCGITQNRDKKAENAAVEKVVAEYVKLGAFGKSSSVPIGKDGRVDNT